MGQWGVRLAPRHVNDAVFSSATMQVSVQGTCWVNAFLFSGLERPGVAVVCGRLEDGRTTDNLFALLHWQATRECGPPQKVSAWGE